LALAEWDEIHLARHELARDSPRQSPRLDRYGHEDGKASRVRLTVRVLTSTKASTKAPKQIRRVKLSGGKINTEEVTDSMTLRIFNFESSLGLEAK